MHRYIGIDVLVLLEEIATIIDNRRREISLQASREVVLNYGKQIVSRLATQLFGVPGMDNDLAMEVRYRLGSRNC